MDAHTHHSRTPRPPDPFATLARTRFLPLVITDDDPSAPALGQALVDGGLHLAEVAFRTPRAVAAMRAMSGVAGLSVGAGTVLTAEQVERAAEAGASFVVSPGISLAVIRRAQELGVPVLPGVATPSEIMQAVDLGVETLKLFPAPHLGGPAVLTALAGPFPQVRFVPTGGLTLTSAPDYLADPGVLAVGGSWVTPRDLVARHRWQDVTRLARTTVDVLSATQYPGPEAP